MTEKKTNEKKEEEKKSQEKKEKENYSFLLYFLKLPPTGFAGSTGNIGGYIKVTCLFQSALFELCMLFLIFSFFGCLY